MVGNDVCHFLESYLVTRSKETGNTTAFFLSFRPLAPSPLCNRLLRLHIHLMISFDPLAHRGDDSAADEEVQAGSADGRMRSSLAEAKRYDSDSAPRKAMPLRRRMERDEMVRRSVLHLKMTAQQVWEFSKCWPYPFYDVSDVWRRVYAMKLDRKIKHATRQSLHERWILEVSTKIWRDSAKAKIPITEIQKECRIGENSGIRSDMRFRLGSKLFHLELQESSLTFRGWKQKLGKYVRYRKRSRPFRVLVVMENETSLNTVYGYARDVMKDHPNLGLFYFAWMPDLMGQYDTVREDVWTTHKREPVSLV